MHKYLLTIFLSISIASVAQVSQKTVIAMSGDGVFSILRRNGLNPTKHYKAFIDLNKDKISNKRELYIGRTYILPVSEEAEDEQAISPTIKAAPIAETIPEKITETTSTVETRNYPLFGEDKARVTIESHTLKNAVYYLVSGHGGPDPGAITNYGGKLISEDEYAYDVTLRLARRLMSHGAQVFLIIKDPNDGIRDEKILKVDYDEVNHPNKKISRNHALRLKQRTRAVNNLYLKHKGKYRRLIVTHVDSRSKNKNIDVFFYHHKKSKKGKSLTQSIYDSFKQEYAKHQPNRTYSGTIGSRNLYLINNTLPPMTYIELGNIKNDKDQKRVLNYKNREALAKWIFNGLLADFKAQNKSAI